MPLAIDNFFIFSTNIPALNSDFESDKKSWKEN